MKNEICTWSNGCVCGHSDIVSIINGDESFNTPNWEAAIDYGEEMEKIDALHMALELIYEQMKMAIRNHDMKSYAIYSKSHDILCKELFIANVSANRLWEIINKGEKYNYEND